MNGYFLPLDALNDLQIKSLDRLIARAKHAHYTDVDMRINGQNERFEADWIKHLRAAPSAEQKVGRVPQERIDATRAALALLIHIYPHQEPTLANAIDLISALAALPAPPTSSRG